MTAIAALVQGPKLTGKYEVHTAHSVYLLDYDELTWLRTPVASEANSNDNILGGVGEFLRAEPTIGERMFIEVPGGCWIYTTPVVSIASVGD